MSAEKTKKAHQRAWLWASESCQVCVCMAEGGAVLVLASAMYFLLVVRKVPLSPRLQRDLVLFCLSFFSLR